MSNIVVRRFNVMSLLIIFTLLIPFSTKVNAQLDTNAIGITEGMSLEYDYISVHQSVFQMDENLDDLRNQANETIIIQQIYYERGKVLTDHDNSNWAFPWVYNSTLDEIGWSLFVYTDWDYWKNNLTSNFEKQNMIDLTNEANKFESKIIDTSGEFGYEFKIFEEENAFGRVSTFETVEEKKYDKTTGIMVYSYHQRIEEGPNGRSLYVEEIRSLTTDLNNSPNLDTRGIFTITLIIGIIIIIIILYRIYYKRVLL